MAFKSITVNGKVSAQAPNLNNVAVHCQFSTNGLGSNVGVDLKPDGSFSTTYVPERAGAWTVQASIAEDALYLAAQSPVIPFNVVDEPAGKLPRVITLAMG